MKLTFYIWSFLITASLNIQAQWNPQKEWEALKDGEKTGWNLKRLDTLHAFLVDSTPVTGYMIIQQRNTNFNATLKLLTYAAQSYQ